MARGKDDKIDNLSKVRLFAGCSKKELGLVAKAADEVTVPAGKVLCEQGKPGFEFYLLLEGEAAVKRSGKKVATLSAGQYFGELALLDRGPRNASVETTTTATLLVLGQREFTGLLDEAPGMAHKMLTTMAQRLRESDAKSVQN